MSRLRELRRSLTPEEKQARRDQRRAALAHRKQQRLERRKQKALRRREAKHARRERTTMTAAHGFRFRMSERQQRGWQRKLEVVEKLKTVAREDQLLEEMIYEMDYAGALAAARDSLAIAEEMGDQQAIITYRAYIERLEGLLRSAGDSLSRGHPWAARVPRRSLEERSPRAAPTCRVSRGCSHRGPMGC